MCVPGRSGKIFVDIEVHEKSNIFLLCCCTFNFLPCTWLLFFVVLYEGKTFLYLKSLLYIIPNWHSWAIWRLTQILRIWEVRHWLCEMYQNNTHIQHTVFRGHFWKNPMEYGKGNMCNNKIWRLHNPYLHLAVSGEVELIFSKKCT